MPHRHDDLFAGIAAFPALCDAAHKAARGKRRKPGVAAFLAGLERNILRLERTLQDGTWRPGGYTVIDVRDPKPRRVSAAPFRDRVVHHALCAVVEPLFERGFIPDSYANGVGKGTAPSPATSTSAIAIGTSCGVTSPVLSRHRSRDPEGDLRRRIACPRTLDLMDRIIDGSNPQEPVHAYFPGDDLFTPHERRRGLPIGNLTSQFFANVYLDGFDHWVKEVLRAPGNVRYVDDFALFHDDPGVLECWRERVADYLAGRRLCSCIRARRRSSRRRSRRPSSAWCSCDLVCAVCPRRTSRAFAIACAGCAIAGAPGR